MKFSKIPKLNLPQEGREAIRKALQYYRQDDAKELEVLTSVAAIRPKLLTDLERLAIVQDIIRTSYRPNPGPGRGDANLQTNI